MPSKDTLTHRQKFCNLRRICAGNDRPLRGADQVQPRPLVGAQPSQPQRRRFRIVLFGMTKGMLICIRRIIKCLLIFMLLSISLSMQSRPRCQENWRELSGIRPISQAPENISKMFLLSLPIRQLSKPTTEDYHALRSSPPGALTLAWTKEREAGSSQFVGDRSRPHLRAGTLTLRPLEGAVQSQPQPAISAAAVSDVMQIRLSSICHVLQHVRPRCILEVRSQATSRPQPEAIYHKPLLSPGRATNGADTPAQRRTLSGARGVPVHACQPFCAGVVPQQ